MYKREDAGHLFEKFFEIFTAGELQTTKGSYLLR